MPRTIRTSRTALNDNANVLAMPSPNAVTLRPCVDRRPFMHEEIAQRAYELYEARGCVDGRDLDDWIEAELELRSDQSDRSAA
jgi:Protein of unknown function (DUF2934)